MSDDSATRDDVAVTEDSRWILWDPRDGEPRFEEDAGEIVCVSDGLVGRLGRDNCYLTAYAEYIGHDGIFGPIKARRHVDLAVGMRCLAKFSLSGSTGVYEVIRVK